MGSEAGDSLIEVLIAVVIISFCAVAILGALSTTLSSAGEHRSLAADDTVLDTMAEQVKNVVELQPNPNWPGGAMGDCPAAGSLTQWYQSTGNVPLPSPLAGSGDYPVTLTNAPYIGYVVNMMNAEYWNGTGWQAGCPSPATGLQKVTVSITSPSHVSDTIDVVVRKQNDGNA